MLKINNISKQFGDVKAVDAVSLEIPAGQFVGIIGRSGAGKSTLLRMINCLVVPTSGTMTFDKATVSGLRGRALNQWRSECAMIFQQFNLVDRLDVLTNVMLGRLFRISSMRSLLRLFSDQDRLDAIKTLEWLGILGTAQQQAGKLSGGQQQRVAIARALHQQPKIILADEPIASLDPVNAQKVMNALQDIHQSHGLTVVTNLHTLDTARRYCQRIIGMREGAVVFDGTPDQLSSSEVQKIYGAESDIDESTTSTEIGVVDPQSNEPTNAQMDSFQEQQKQPMFNHAL